MPPVDATSFAPNPPLTQETLAVALYRMYLAMDVPMAATVAPAAASVVPNSSDLLTVRVTNRLGQPLSGAALARYAPTYRLEGSNASMGQVTSGAFQATVPGAYTVVAELARPFMASPVMAEASVSVYLPPPPAAPTGVTASEVPGGVALSWIDAGGATGYQVYESVTPFVAFTPVSQADGGTASASATSATVSGLEAGATYTFEVAALGRFGQSTSTPSAGTPFGSSATPVNFEPATAATRSIGVGNVAGTMATHGPNNCVDDPELERGYGKSADEHR